MKILESQITPVAPAGNDSVETAKTQGNGVFAELLTQRMEEVEHTGSTESINLLDSVPAVTAQAETTLPVICQEIGSLLDILEQYGEALGSQKTLKEIEPIASILDAQADKLQELNKEQENSALRELAEQAAAQAKVEVAKFKRGDYL